MGGIMSTAQRDSGRLIRRYRRAPDEAVDPYFAQVVSLLHFDGSDGSTTFTDVKGKTHSAFGNAQIDTAQSKFGGAAGLFDGTDDYITTPDHDDFDFGSGDFTVELQLRLNAVGGFNQGLVVRDQIGGTRGWLFFVAATTNLVTFAAWIGGSSTSVADPTAMTTGGSFKHFAAARDGSTLRLYRDGVQVASTAISGAIGAPDEPCVTGTLWGIGANVAGTNLNGWVDERRITKGFCRYPGGTTFTPPVAPYPNV